MSRRPLLPLLLLLAVPLLAAEAETSFLDVLAGQAAPLKLLLNELTPEWRRVTLAGNFDPLPRVFASLVSSQLGAPMQAETYYTKGQTLVMNGEVYLVAYGVHRPVTISLPHYGEARRPPKPDPLKADTPLALSLLCLRTAGSFTEITPFNLEAEIAQSMGRTVKDANTESVSRLRQVAIAIQMFVQDNQGKYPPMQDAAALKKAILPYLGNEETLLNPATRDPYQPNPVLAGRKEAEVKNPTLMAVIWEAAPAADGTRGVGFADGHVSRIAEKDWPAVKAKSVLP
ncbi:MAG TPA: hypothetical protein PLZ36_16045 [Armatimonadota bacterium]|nr:hypothetical protein [Armatimonadota bacterium]